jgi:hypothetical protein
MMKPFVFSALIFCCFLSGLVHGQIISGVVLEKESGLPLPFANVFVSNTTLGTVTKEDGSFTIKGDFPQEIEVVASFIGYFREVQKVLVRSSNSIELKFELSINEAMLTEIELKSKRDKQWARQFRKFEEVFLALPDDSYKSQIEILNPWVVDFEMVKPKGAPNYLIASSEEPLQIVNNALGYQIDYYLQDFRLTREEAGFIGQVYYKPIPTLDLSQMTRWQNAREENYFSSLRHFNLSLILNNTDSVHFGIYRAPYRGPDDRTPNHFYEIGRSIFPTQMDSILRRPLGDGTFRVFLPERLEILHLDRSWPNNYYNSVFHPISWIEAKEKFFDVDRKGILIDPRQLILSGYLSRQRVSRHLPLDYEPKSNFVAVNTGDQVDSQNVLTQIDQLREKPWLVTNKPYYYPGEKGWFGGQMLYQNEFLKDTLSRVIHVDLISEGTIHQSHQFPIKNGKIQGGFDLPAELPAKSYTLRAYTNWSKNFDQDGVFLIPIPVVEKGMVPTKKSMTQEQTLQLIEVKTDFSLVDSVPYRVMDLALDFVDEFENPIDVNFYLSILDSEQVVDFPSAQKLEDALTWLDSSLPEDFDFFAKFPIEYGISLQGIFIKDKKRQDLEQNISIVRGDLEDYGTVKSDTTGSFWATGLYFQDTASIHISALDEKGRAFGTIELIPNTSLTISSSLPDLVYDVVPFTKNDLILDVAEDFVLLEEFVLEESKEIETMAERNYGYGTPTFEVRQDEMEKLTWQMILGKYFNSFKNLNMGESTSGVLAIIDGQSFPYQDGVELITLNYEPFDLESIKIYSDPFSRAIFGMAGYAGVIMIETRKGSRSGPQFDSKFDPTGFQTFQVRGFSSFLEFPKNPPDNRYLSKKPTIFWEPKGKTVQGSFKTRVKIPYGVESLRIKIDGISEDGEAFSKVQIIEIQKSLK